MKKCGLQTVVECMEWKSCFWNPETRMLLTIYVDDFKLAGPTEHFESTWKALREHILLSDPEPVDQYLGCKHIAKHVTVRVPNPPTREQMEKAVAEESRKPTGKAGEPEESDTADHTKTKPCPPGFKDVTVSVMEYDMSQFLESCLENMKSCAIRPPNGRS